MGLRAATSVKAEFPGSWIARPMLARRSGDANRGVGEFRDLPQLASAVATVYHQGMKRLFLPILLFAALATGAAFAQSLLVRFDTGSLAIVTEAGRHEFNVELASTPEQRSQGLMYRREMAADAGMLFDFASRPGRASMWMKNTLIPLDMLFIKSDGKIESIAERTVPHSLEAVSSRGLVRYVLELNGGTVARLGIGPGDRVELPKKDAE
jgi:uncharacterized membrane protein (UPF0127 family)